MNFFKRWQALNTKHENHETPLLLSRIGKKEEGGRRGDFVWWWWWMMVDEEWRLPCGGGWWWSSSSSSSVVVVVLHQPSAEGTHDDDLLYYEMAFIPISNSSSFSNTRRNRHFNPSAWRNLLALASVGLVKHSGHPWPSSWHHGGHGGCAVVRASTSLKWYTLSVL